MTFFINNSWFMYALETLEIPNSMCMGQNTCKKSCTAFTTLTGEGEREIKTVKYTYIHHNKNKNKYYKFIAIFFICLQRYEIMFALIHFSLEKLKYCICICTISCSHVCM